MNHVALGSDGTFYGQDCTYGFEQNCMMVRVIEDGTSSDIATLAHLDDDTQHVTDLTQVKDFCVTPAGSLVISSERFAGVFVFDDGKGGPPAELAEPLARLSVERLDSGVAVEISPGNFMRLFGDAELAGHGLNNRRRRAQLTSAANWATTGNYILLALLIGLYALGRSTGLFAPGVAESWKARAEAALRNLVLFDLRPVAFLLGARGVVTGVATWHCGECEATILADATTCLHQPRRPRAALVLGTVFPGLGHLHLRNFRRGRAVAILAAASAFETLYWAAPVYFGTMRMSPWTYLAPLWAFLAVWIASVIDIVRWLRRDEAQKATSARGLEELAE